MEFIFLTDMVLWGGWILSLILYLVGVMILRRKFEEQLAAKDRIIELQEEKIRKYETRLKVETFDGIDQEKLLKEFDEMSKKK